MGEIAKRIATATMGFSLVALPMAAVAQDVPSYATPGTETIHGKVAAVTGRYTVNVDDERGFTDSVTMHDGTVIEPQGVSLEVGQDVSIIGHTDGKTFDADEVDTDGADESTTYNDAPSDSYSGSYSEGVYPPYVTAIGGDEYYYGNGYGGYYYDAGGGNYHPHGGGSGNGSTGSPHGPRPRTNPVVYPIVRGSGLNPRGGYSAPSPPRTYSAPSAPRSAPAPRSFSGSVHASSPSHR